MAREPDIGHAWCLRHGPQLVRWEDRIGRDFRLTLFCGCTRKALLVHHRGYRWVLPAKPSGHRIETVVLDPDGAVVE